MKSPGACNSVQTALAESIDRRFEERIQSHLCGCRSCSAFCEDLVELEELAKVLGDSLRTPAGFHAETVAKLMTLRKRRFSPFRLGMVAASVILAVSVGVFSFWEPISSASEPMNEPSELLWLADDPVLENGSAQDDSDYVEVILGQSEDGEVILRLPPVIKIRQTELHEENSVHKVSH